MLIQSRLVNNTLYINLAGELDENTSSYAREKMDTMMALDNFRQIVIDLSELTFMDSTGIGILLGRYKKMKSHNIPIFICNPSSHAERIFQMTGLYDIMPKIS